MVACLHDGRSEGEGLESVGRNQDQVAAMEVN